MVPIDVTQKAIKVLFSDDSSIIRKHLHTLLSDLSDIKVIGESDTVSETIERVSTLLPDVVILDIHMPDGNGIQALRYIKAAHPEIKVIMLTNHANPFYREACLQAGASYFLDKSTEFETIGSVLTQLTEQA